MERRAILRNLYLKEKNFDIYSFYIGTIVFRALELIVRLFGIFFFSSKRKLKRHMDLEDVRIGIKNRTGSFAFKITYSYPNGIN